MKYRWYNTENYPKRYSNNKKLRGKIPHCELTGDSMKTDTTWSEFPDGGKPSEEKTQGFKQRNKFRKAEFLVLQPGIWWAKLKP